MATKAEHLKALMKKYPYGSLNIMRNSTKVILTNAEHDKTVEEWATASAASDANATLRADGGSAANYAEFRTDPQSGFGYKQITEQLDQLWHDIDDGKLDKTGAWYLAIKAVKDKYAKP